MPKRNDPTDLEENPAYQLWVATNAWQRMVRCGLEPLGVTHAQHAVLVAVSKLGANGEPVTQADACRFGSLDPNMASQVARVLEKEGYLERHPHPNDRRANVLRLTGAGEELVERCRAVIRPLIEEFFAPLGDDRRELARMLRIVNLAHDDRAALCGVAPKD